MNQSPIIVIINKKPYTLSAMNIEELRNIPTEDRQQLITLLEAVKQLENLVQKTAARPSSSTQQVASVLDSDTTPASRLGSGAVDALMAQLIMEEKQNQKNGITKQSIQKWMLGFAAIVFLLILIL